MKIEGRENENEIQKERERGREGELDNEKERYRESVEYLNTERLKMKYR